MASKYAGYTGKVKLVDLTHETVQEYPWTDRDRELYLGGKIMANKIFLDLLTGTESAFSEENPVIITTGPLTLSGAPSSTRYDISAISPLTGLPASSNCGGDFGLYLKRAGYDALILSGRCSSHRWLEIHNDSFIFHDAERAMINSSVADYPGYQQGGIINAKDLPTDGSVDTTHEYIMLDVVFGENNLGSALLYNHNYVAN